MSERGRTIREAVAIALEVVPGHPREWTVLQNRQDALRDHVVAWVTDYARRRGVILADADVTSELDAVIAGLRRTT